MSAWNNPDRWAALCSGTACPICTRGQPLDIATTLDASWATMQEDAPVKGYVCLVSKIHAVDLHDLPSTAAASFMRDAQLVSKALAMITGSVKMNYEIHGNSLPHLHMHFFPRYPGDQFDGQPINPRLVIQPIYGAGEFEHARDAFVTKVDELRRQGSVLRRNLDQAYR